jgi:hypothetical protein
MTYVLFPTEEMMDSMIAPKDGDLYKSVVSRMYAVPKVFERIDNWKELYK